MIVLGKAEPGEHRRAREWSCQVAGEVGPAALGELVDQLE